MSSPRHQSHRLVLLLGALLLAAFTLVRADDLTEYEKVNALVDHIPPSKFDEVIKKDAQLVFFGSNGCPHCRLFTPVWFEAQKRSDAMENMLHLHKVECTGRAEDEDLCADQKIKAWPTVKLYVNGEFKEDFEGSRDIAWLNDFIDKKTLELVPIDSAVAHLTAVAKAGTQPQPHINPDGKMVHLTQETFAIMTNNTPWFVMFHAPWCGHCQKLKPVFEELAPSLKGLVNIGAVDCTTQSSICKQFGVRGYPTLNYLLQPHVAIEYKSARTFQQLRDFAVSFSSKPAFKAVKGSEIPAILAEKEVSFFLVHDPRTMPKKVIESFAAVAAGMRHSASFYVTPDDSARTLLRAPSTGPALLAIKDNGDLTIEHSHPLTTPSARSEIRHFVSQHRHPRVLHLDADNQEEILGGDRLVVIAVIDPAVESARGSKSVLKTLKTTAVAWTEKEKAERLHDLVVFTWLDGSKWAAYVERVYGLTPSQLPTLIIADPKEDAYYDTDNAGRAIAFGTESLVQTINEVLDGVALPKYTSGFMGRIVANINKSVKSTWAFLRYNMVFMLCFAVVLALGYMYGGIPGLRRARADPKAE
ncbi:thioredoxin-like protein [Powellomyces hirtus]|nr:thioredoxin-like protein [Powellomyces hirtus]